MPPRVRVISLISKVSFPWKFSKGKAEIILRLDPVAITSSAAWKANKFLYVSWYFLIKLSLHNILVDKCKSKKFL